MRALESALQLLAKRLGVKRKNNWQQYLVGIEDVLKQRYTPRSKNRIFYSECAAQLSHVKNAWRNPTMHIEKTYTHKHTEDIFNAVKALLRQFATKLKEPEPKAVHF